MYAAPLLGCLAFVLGGAVLPAASEARRAPETATYRLSARLDAAAHRITAHGEIEFENTSRRPIDHLFFHLYLNAFKNERSLFLRSPFQGARSGRRLTHAGWIEVESLTIPARNGGDLWDAAASHSPGDPEDETDIFVPLPEPLEPGRTLHLSIVFQAQLPEIVERTGYAGDFHFVAQWFPKLAKLEPDGSFAHFAFHPHAEFYADYARYDVTLDVPFDYRVGATGRRVSERVEATRELLRFVARDVHDFAWTAWGGFLTREERIGGVGVHLLYPARHERVADVTLDTLRRALPYFSARYGEYPYDTLTVVHPPEAAAPAGGMEYPTLITTGGPWWTPYVGARYVEGLTVHELGHQWFYGLVGSDERRWPFLDEGLTSYVESEALANWYDAGSAFSGFGLQLSTWAFHRAAAVEAGLDEPIALSAAEFSSFESLAGLAYSRTATLLETLARGYGREALMQALGNYAREQRFGHPEPRDLFAAIERAISPHAAQALEAAVLDRGWVDYTVDSPSSAPEPPDAGDPHDSAAGSRWVGRVLVHRRGELELPVTVELVADDGTRVRHHWDGVGTRRAFDYRGSSALAFAIVDPERRVLLDQDWSNNARASAPGRAPRLRERLAYWIGTLLSWLGP